MYETGKIKGSKGGDLAEVMTFQDPEALQKFKLSKQDYLMSQIDLDPIESHYSQEQQQLSSNLKQTQMVA